MVTIDKVIMVLLKPDDMAKVNNLTDVDEFATDNWVDYETINQTPELQDYITHEQEKALITCEANYIVFRIDY